MNEHFWNVKHDIRYEEFNLIFWFVSLFATVLNILFAGIRIRINFNKLKANQKNLYQTELRYRNVFENSHSAIGIYSFKSGKLIACNQMAVELFGFSEQSEMLKIKIGDYVADEQFNGETAEEFIKETIDELMHKKNISTRYYGLKKNKTIFIADMNVVIDSNLDEDKALLFIRDVTEEHNAGQTIRKHLDLVDEKNNELKKYIESNLQLENFAHLASHDLKAPLNTIQSFSRLLKDLSFDKLNTVEKQFLDHIVNESKNMSSTITSLLNFSMSSNKKIELELLNPVSIIEELLASIKIDLEKYDATIDIENCEFEMYADKTLFKELFQNLILNACKFARKEESPFIKIEFREDEQFTYFSIADNGIGIANEFKEKVFLIFQKLHKKSQYEGTGIGLAISKKIVEMHGGQIWIEQSNGPGTRFVFSMRKDIEEELKFNEESTLYA